ncbi:MAG: hypothetical protein FK734_00705 [Asgard group archaeon]|nr:hypothetical protein [Asgard group archaeon]
MYDMRRRKRSHHPMGCRPPYFGPIVHRYRDEFFDELETKEEALEFLEIQKYRLKRHIKHMQKEITRAEEIFNDLDQQKTEIQKMEEYSSDKAKELFNEMLRKYAPKRAKEEKED